MDCRIIDATPQDILGELKLEELAIWLEDTEQMEPQDRESWETETLKMVHCFTNAVKLMMFVREIACGESELPDLMDDTDGLRLIYGLTDKFITGRETFDLEKAIRDCKLHHPKESV